MDGSIGGVGGVGMASGTGGFSAMGGAPSQIGASPAAQSSEIGATSLPPDVTVKISSASKAALAADSLKVASANTVQPTTGNDETDETDEIDTQNGVPPTISAPNSISADTRNLLNEDEWDIDDVLLALWLLREQRI